MQSRTSPPQVWIRSPLWDNFWLLNTLWLAPVFFVAHFLNWDRSFLQVLTGALRDSLSSAHLLLPIWTVFALGQFREMLRTQPKRYVLLPLFWLVMPFSACLYLWQLESASANQIILSSLAEIYLVWNLWHFASHHFGVLALYRARIGQSSSVDRLLDRGYCLFHIGILNPISMIGLHIRVCEAIGLQGVATFLQSVRHWVAPEIIITLSLASVVFMILLEARKSHISSARILYLSMIGIQTVCVALVPGIAYALLVSVNHWLGEIGLGARVNSQSRWNFPLVVVGVISIGLIFEFFFFRVFGAREYFGAILGKLSFLEDRKLDLFGCLMVGFFFAVHFLHMLYDRYLFSFRRPECRAVADALLETRSSKMVSQ